MSLAPIVIPATILTIGTGLLVAQLKWRERKIDELTNSVLYPAHPDTVLKEIKDKFTYNVPFHLGFDLEKTVFKNCNASFSEESVFYNRYNPPVYIWINGVLIPIGGGVRTVEKKNRTIDLDLPFLYKKHKSFDWSCRDHAPNTKWKKLYLRAFLEKNDLVYIAHASDTLEDTFIL